MPRRTDIKSVLIIGAGPIVIGQACEFDYSGAQACKALREEGYRVVLVKGHRGDQHTVGKRYPDFRHLFGPSAAGLSQRGENGKDAPWPPRRESSGARSRLFAGDHHQSKSRLRGGWRDAAE